MLELKLFIPAGALIITFTLQQNCFGGESVDRQAFIPRNSRSFSSITDSPANRLIVCENGEEMTIKADALPSSPIIRVQKDGPIIYSRGKINWHRQVNY